MTMVHDVGPQRWWQVQAVYLSTVKAFERALAPLGLTLPQVLALQVLTTTSEPVTPSQVAQALALESQSVTGLVDRLERRGWVRRRHDLADRRAVRLQLTRAGQAAVQAAADPWAATVTQMFAGLSPAELVELTRLLGRVVEHAHRQTALDQHPT